MTEGQWRVQVDGGPRFRRTLRKAGTDMKDLTRLHRQVGDIIVPRARAIAPVGPAAGGHIRNTIRATAAQRHAVIRAGDKRKPYGQPVHWGWQRRNIKGQPWIAQAASETEPEWFALYTKGIEKLLDQIKGI